MPVDQLSFNLQELGLRIRRHRGTAIVEWMGRCGQDGTINDLQQLLAAVVNALTDEPIMLDLTALDSITRPTVPILVGFLKDCTRISPDLRIKFNASSSWQVRSFCILQKLCAQYANVQFESGSGG